MKKYSISKNILLIYFINTKNKLIYINISKIITPNKFIIKFKFKNIFNKIN